MRKIAGALALIALMSVGAAHARLAANGLRTNGVQANGNWGNGLRTNGLRTNGLRTNGIRTNGAKSLSVEASTHTDLPSMQQLASMPLAR